jgi:superfamily II DNA or RNA helicase
MIEPEFHKGQVVKLVNTDKTGVICEDPKVISGQNYYVLFIENQYKTYSEESLELSETKKVDFMDLFKKKEFASLKDFLSYLTYIKVERPLSNNLYAFLSSRTQFEVHQFKPVLKYLQSPYQRLLVADEVGVGKTIEAAIIYTELLSRNKLDNVLIICPSALRLKWQSELRKRFNEDFGLINSSDMKLLFRKFERSPSSVSIKGIASMQMLRSEEMLKNLNKLQIPFDLVIIDEAHHMRNQETNSYNLGETISMLADGLVMLSATPLHLGNRDLFNLFRILVPEEFNSFDTFEEQVKPNEFINLALQRIRNGETPIQILEAISKVESTSQNERFTNNTNYQFCKKLLMGKTNLNRDEIILLQRKLSELNVLSQIYTRTKKKEIDIKSPVREPITLEVEFSKEEMEFYNLVSSLFLRLHPGCPPGFLLQMPQRQVASCIPASIEYLRDIHKNGIIDISKEDTYDEEEEDDKKLVLTEQDLGLIKQIIEQAQKLQDPDSKTKKFLEEITNIKQKGDIKKIIIFSFFKRTLKYLEKKLKEIGVNILRIDGDVPFEERETLLTDFEKKEDFIVLLSSEVGGEGLDMQFCNCMMNYDLPWNPMRVEQRIGRLDRYGQQSPKILIYNFSVMGTIESNIFLRLCNRIGIFEQYVGELEPIIGEMVKQLTQEALNVNLSPEQQKAKVDQMAMVIERKKQDLELFDKERSKFLGQDNYFTEQMCNIQKNERFITSNEIINLLTSFIKEEFPKTKIIENGGGIYTISPDERLKEFFIDHFKREKIGSEVMDNLLDLMNKTKLTVTFDYQVANSNSHIEFITIRHPFIKSIINFYKKKQFKILSSLKFDDKENIFNKGEYAFFIYLLEIKGFTKSLTFVPIVVSLQNLQVNIELSDKLLNILRNSQNITIDVSEESVAKCEEIALEAMISQKMNKETELKETNESLVNDRISSLTQTFNIRKKRIMDTIDRMKENLSEKTKKIIIMKQSELVNLERHYNERKAKLEDDRKILVGHEFIGGGLLNVR